MSTIPAHITSPLTVRRPHPTPWLTVRRSTAGRLATRVPPASVRLLRGWLARWQRAAAIGVALVAVAVMLGTALVETSIAEVPAVSPITVVVQSGDTVWELARAHAPAGVSVQDYASQVVIHNDITATALRPGTVLVLPQD